MKINNLMSIILVMVVLLTGIISCGKPVPQAEGTDTTTAVKTGFNFIFKYGVGAKNILDTFKDTYTKDMVTDPAITIELVLSAEEMDSIYQKMVEIDFFSYPDEYKVTVPEGEAAHLVTPHSSYNFKVEKDSIVKELIWKDEIMNPDEKADRLRELISLIRDILESKPEYQVLPEPSGGYI